ncbi:YfhO family protein, partial [Ardenticatena maritima]
LPFWNPHIWGGQPGLADPQMAALYPPAVLNALLHGGSLPLIALEWEVIAHVAWATIGMYILARAVLQTKTRLPAIGAALAFGLGGYLTGFPVQQVAIMETIAWTPWWLWTLRRAALSQQRRERIRFALLAAAVFALALLAGHPQSALYMAYLGFAYTLFCLWHAPVRTWSHRLLTLVLPFALGIALAAVQLLPTLDFIARSERQQLDFQFVSPGLNWHDVIFLFVPNADIGTPLYLGPIVLVLLVAALKSRHASLEKWFWLSVGLLSLLLAFGGTGAFYAIAYLLLPGWNAVRNQERALLMFSVAQALLVGWGLLALMTPTNTVRATAARLSAGVAAVGWVLVFALMALESPLTNGILMLALFGSLAWLIVAFAEEAPHPLVPASLLTVVLAFNLMSVNQRYHQGPPPETIWPERTLYNVIAETAGHHRVNDASLLPPEGNAGMLYGYEALGGNNPLRLERTRRFLNAIDSWYEWKLLAVQYVVSQDPNLDPNAFSRLYEEEGFFLWEVREPRPRAWSVATLVQMTDDDAIADRVDDRDFDAYTTAIVEVSPPPVEGTATVNVLDQRTGFLQVGVQASAPTFVVLAEIADPGWHATLDGQPVEWLRTDGFIIGVPVPPGEHTLTLTYRPPRWLLGLGVSSVAWLLWCGGLFWAWRSHRREEAHAA